MWSSQFSIIYKTFNKSLLHHVSPFLPDSFLGFSVYFLSQCYPYSLSAIPSTFTFKYFWQSLPEKLPLLQPRAYICVFVYMCIYLLKYVNMCTVNLYCIHCSISFLTNLCMLVIIMFSEYKKLPIFTALLYFIVQYF